MRYLITGAAGYIGSVLVPALLARGHEVWALDRFPRDDASLAACCAYADFHPVRGDARDEVLVRSLMAKADVIVPLAALVGAPICEADPWTATAVNRDAVRFVARNLSRGQRLVYPNTNSGYGVAGDAPCTEDMPLNPISVYGRTKCAAERAVLDAGGISLRLATVFGASPRMRLDLLVNDFVHRAVIDRALTLFEGHHRRSVVHVQDVARTFIFASENAYKVKTASGNYLIINDMPGQSYNVVGDNVTKLELCSRIAERVPGFVYNEAATGRDPDQRDYAVSGDRLAALGVHLEWTLDEGITELVRLYTMLNARRFTNA